MRLIDADAIDFAFPLPDNLEGMLKQIGIEMAKIRVSLAPTIEAEPVRHGRWENCADKHDRGMDLKCSVCGNRASSFVGGTEDWWDADKPNYCPNCGAKMGGDDFCNSNKEAE